MGKRLSLTMNGIEVCSGSCEYCIAARNSDYTVSCQELINTDQLTAKQMKVDWDRLEATLRERKPNTIDIWGGDPVTCFTNLVDLYDMIKATLPGCRVSSSTNGLPFKRDDIVAWIKENDITLQLSHDGLGQKYRTGAEDPLDFDSTRELIRIGKLTAINATLSGVNPSLYGNMRYFNNKLQEIFPEVYSNTEVASKEVSNIFRRLYIKLNHIMDGEYPDDQKKFVLKGRALDDYLYDWDVYFEQYRANRTNTLFYMPFNKYLQEQLRRGSNITEQRQNECRKFQVGLTPNSMHIDTLGNNTDCNLQDSDHPVPNRANELPEYCNDCKYKLSGECNMCGAVPKRKDVCEYFYRWNQFLSKTRNTKICK